MFGQRVAALAGRGQLGAKRVEAPDHIAAETVLAHSRGDREALRIDQAKRLRLGKRRQPCLSGCRRVQYDLAAHRRVIPKPLRGSLRMRDPAKTAIFNQGKAAIFPGFGREPIEHTLSRIRQIARIQKREAKRGQVQSQHVGARGRILTYVTAVYQGP